MNPCDPNLPRHVSLTDHPLANPQPGKMTNHVDPFAPYAAPELSRGLRRNWPCILLSVVDWVIYLVGIAGAIYCLLMLICPEYPEGLAVSLTSMITGNELRNGDYRFAWHAVFYAIPIALVFLLRLGIASAFALRQRQKAKIVLSSKREQAVN